MNEQIKAGVVAFGFGEPATLQSNQTIAAKTVEVADTKDATFICTDRDVAPHLDESSIEAKALNPTLFPHTYRLAVFTIEQAKDSRINTLHVVAASCHIWRCRRDLHWAAKDQGVEVQLILHPATGNLYSSLATTWYTRAAWIWWPLEFFYRLASSLFPGLYKRLRS